MKSFTSRQKCRPRISQFWPKFTFLLQQQICIFKIELQPRTKMLGKIRLLQEICNFRPLSPKSMLKLEESFLYESLGPVSISKIKNIDMGEWGETKCLFLRNQKDDIYLKTYSSAYLFCSICIVFSASSTMRNFNVGISYIFRGKIAFQYHISELLDYKNFQKTIGKTIVYCS